jgi:hypothetical protein
VSPHDVAKLLYEIEELRAEHAQRTAERDEAWLTNATLRADLARANAERDEARREACELLARSMKGPMEIAAMRGWDCFEKKEVQT